MLSLQIINGKMAGREFCARHFPFRVGTGSEADLRLEEPGVCGEHLEIIFDPKGFALKARPGAATQVNDVPVSEVVLRNGDVISAGSARFRFGLSVAAQRDHRKVEWLLWIGLAVLCAAQVGLLCLLR